MCWGHKAPGPLSKSDLHKLPATQANVSRWALRLSHALSPLFTCFSRANGAFTVRKTTGGTHLQIPTGGLQEKPGPFLVHISNSDEFPHRLHWLFLARHFDLLLQQLVRLHLRKQATDDGSYLLSTRGHKQNTYWNSLQLFYHSVFRLFVCFNKKCTILLKSFSIFFLSKNTRILAAMLIYSLANH